MKHRTALLAGTILLALLVFPPCVHGQEVMLKNLVLDNVAGTIQLRFGVKTVDTEELKAYLEEGVTLRLQCSAKLKANKSLWWDETLREQEVAFELKNNPLTRKYVLRNVTEKRTMRNKDLETLIRSNWGHMVLEMGRWPKAPKGREYVLELKVRLERADIPVWLRRALFFWSWEVVPVKTYRMNFTF
jgi:hypothetical protein